MREGTSERGELIADAKANTLYLFVYLPIAVTMLAALGLGLPYLLFGVTPSVVLRGAQIIAWGAYIIVCLLAAMLVASIVWLRIVRGFVSRCQAEKIIMPMGRDPIGRWLVARYVPADKHGGKHGV